MIRLFITTDLQSTLSMYDIHSGYKTENDKASDLLKILPKEIEFGGNKIIILQDERNNRELVVSTNWNNRAINSENDFILFHQTHPPSNEILKKFKANKGGSHIINGYHDKIYGILFDDQLEKFSRILEILGFTEKEITEKETLESKLNFLHHCLTPDGLSKEEVKNSDWAKLDEFTKLTEANDGPFGDNYLSALSTLRDKLLVS